jgi:hypothetical protein
MTATGGCPVLGAIRFRPVFYPFFSRLLTVFHRFSPFLRFSEKRTGDEPYAARGVACHGEDFSAAVRDR